MKIGMIGVGRMGSGICNNFIKSHNDVTVFDLSPDALEQFRGRAAMASSETELFKNTDITCMVLPGSPQVEAVTGKFLEAGVAGKTVIDFSTSYPVSTQKIYKKFKELGGRYADISMVGSPDDSANAAFDLTFGGDRELYDELKDLIAPICKNLYYCGPSGAGNFAKLFTNYISILFVGLYGEIFPLAEKMKFDAGQLCEIVRANATYNEFFEFVAPKIVNQRYDPAFALNFCIKDLSYVKKLFDEFQANTFILDGALNMFREARDLGYGEHDCSEVTRVARKTLSLE